MTPQHQVITSAKELGEVFRARRVTAGLSLRQTKGVTKVSVHFLRDIEEGDKEGMQFGKVLTALHGLGLDLAVVPKSPGLPASTPPQGYSQAVGVEFPYDWSNSAMAAETFIRKVLRAGRFMDILKTVKYFDMERVSQEVGALGNTPQATKVAGILARIYQGKLLAERSHVDTP
jgi:hypothetical protein